MVRAGHAVMLCVLTLLCIGVLMVHSAGLTIQDEGAVTLGSILISRSSAYMVVALVAMFACAAAPIRELALSLRVRRWIPLVLPLMLVCLALAYAPVIGHEVNGSNRWVRVPGIGLTMQPSEIAKWGMIVLLAWYATRYATVLGSFRKGLLPGLLLIALVGGIVAKEDLGTGVLIAAVGCAILVSGGARILHLLMMAPLGAAAFGLLVLASPYRLKRLTSFANPFADPEGAGYHMIQSLGAVANGGGTGRGIGFGLQKFGYLPEDRTDFLFAVICEETGIAGAGVVIALYIALLWAGWSIVQRQTIPVLKLIGIGVLATVGFQALINLTVVTGLAPTKGIALPLLSSGGTGWILTAASLGLLVAMDRERLKLSTETTKPVSSDSDEAPASTDGSGPEYELVVRARGTRAAETSQPGRAA